MVQGGPYFCTFTFVKGDLSSIIQSTPQWPKNDSDFHFSHKLYFDLCQLKAFIVLLNIIQKQSLFNTKLNEICQLIFRLVKFYKFIWIGIIFVCKLYNFTWVRVNCSKCNCSNLDCSTLFSKMSSARHRKHQLLDRQKYAVSVPHFVFEQLIKKSATAQNFEQLTKFLWQ